MKNGDVLTAYETLQRISSNPNLKFNVALGYMLAKNKEILRQEAVIIYNMRREIIMEHGRIDENKITIPSEYVDEVNQKIDDLMNIESDVKICQIPIELIDKYELSMEDIEGLKELIQPFGFTEYSITEEKTDG